MSRPFNALTFVADQEIDRHLARTLVALNALAPALEAARAAGDSVHFARLAGHFTRFCQDALTLDPTAPVPHVSLDLAVPTTALPRPAPLAAVPAPPQRAFDPLTFLADQEIARHRDQALVALRALVPALERARADGDAVHFARLAGHFARFRRDALTLDPAAPVPEVALEFGQPLAVAA